MHKSADWSVPNGQNPYDYIFEDFNLKDLSALVILKHLNQQVFTDTKDFYNLIPEHIEVNLATFSHLNQQLLFPIVQIQQRTNSVKISCRCDEPKNKLCSHQAQVLYNILKRNELKVFFDSAYRIQQLKQVAVDYGLEEELDLDTHFNLSYLNGKVDFKPKKESLFPLNKDSKFDLEQVLLKPNQQKIAIKQKDLVKENLVVVIAKHKYYSHLIAELYEAETSKLGKLKNPLKLVNTKELSWGTSNAEELKFYQAIIQFEQNFSNQEENEISALKALIANPMQLKFYLQDAKATTGINANSINPVQVSVLNIDLRLSVNQKEDYYDISAQLMISGNPYSLDQILIVQHYFVQFKNHLFLIDQLDMLNIILFFRKHSNRLVLHKSKYPDFKESILNKLEDRLKITYSYLKPATKKQIEEQGFDLVNEKILYLSESEDFVLITPVMRYGDLEIPVLSKRQIKSKDKLGNLFVLQRDEEAELQFIAEVLKQHPYFYEQESNDCYYLHRKRFLEYNWFLDAFEAWRSKDIQILGFNNLKNNKLNAFKADINIRVMSGTDWFETKVKVKFGKETVALKHLHKSIRNKSKFITLDDGTQGILPDEWIEKFNSYFKAAEVVDDVLRTDRINFTSIENLYEDELLDAKVREELINYKNQFAHTDQIIEVPVSPELKTVLRPYQQEGLNWLNFLDDFNFGACLADDMGLGKTIQILAFILSQRTKVEHNVNLVVVPASLIYNWQAEIEKFAPSIKILTIYGADRNKSTDNFNRYELIITSYGTLLSDIRFLKEYRFNYIFLDESQNIKNPDSQRYKAVKLLRSRNRVVITGTPIENNTFDLYGQLSFACPGLLGSKHHFSTVYTFPIDQFKDKKRTQELQEKIAPFILRRTKEEVAKELPEKTEMVLYCEMGAEQREVYEANKKEIQDFIEGKNDDELAKSSMHVLKSITRLRQICNSAALLADGKSFAMASSKIDVLMEQIENGVGKHKILVFSQFVSMLDLIKVQLQQRGIQFAYLTGQTKNRGDVVNSFQTNADISVFLISLKAGGIGLNLTQADYVYLVDPWWNPAVENQAIDRAYRIGQQKNVMAVRLICPNTIEEKIMKLQAGKKDLVKNLVQNDESYFKHLNKKDLLGLLG